MPQYKLIYFNSKGRAELPRLLFAYADVEYEDFRFANREEFLEKIKPNMPTGRVPVLEIDGKLYPESGAIFRYLATEFKLYGKDNVEALQIDGVVETMNDILQVLTKIFYENDEAKKAELQKKAAAEDIPVVLSLLEKLAGGDVFVGDSITAADIAFFRTMEVVLSIVTGLTLDNYPKLKSINDKVAKEPKIAAWLAKRPETPN
ncbi:hematopoietic prostaglandin D synthase-like [Amphiura filiformis]|uniref:hematopoietic prostaglandin D synthase-like n=1 Tax=Amphiura filiformis TaxID=82378 RepID=UPI003B20F81F